MQILKGLWKNTEIEITGVDPNNKKEIVVNLNTKESKEKSFPCDRLTFWESKDKGVLVFLSWLRRWAQWLDGANGVFQAWILIQGKYRYAHPPNNP